jgi:hypothetical protein
MPSAACLRSVRPTSVDPVKLSLRSRGSAMIEPGLGQQRGEQQGGQRGEFGRLEYDGAARCQRGRDLTGPHGQREVPRRDQQAGPDRMPGNDHPAGRLGVDAVAAGDPYCFLGEPAEELPAIAHLGLRLGQWFAHLDRHQQGQIVPTPLDRLERPAEDLRPLARRRLGPVGSGNHSRIQRSGAVRHSGIGDGLHHRTGGWILDGKGRSRSGRPPLAADEEPVWHRAQQRCFGRIRHRRSSVTPAAGSRIAP